MKTYVEPGDQLRIHHNGDWSGKALVSYIDRTVLRDGILEKWDVDGYQLLSGRIEWSTTESGKKVPADVVGRAVAYAVKERIIRRAARFVEDLW